jgi:outer membrane immunogenic protein
MRIKVTSLLAATLSLGLAHAAFGADMPVKAPVRAAPVAVAPTWTGFYLGASVGYAWMEDDLDETLRGTGTASGFTPISTSPDGVKLGGFAGYNWQFGTWVLGVEGDIEWAGLGSDQALYIAGGGDAYESSADWQASIRGRFGYAYGDWLLYATGGVAFANINYDYIDVAPAATEGFSSTRTGWTVGGGVDWRFAPNWFARLEYRYADFGDETNLPTVFGGLFDEHHSTTEHAIRLGVAYKFW